MHCQQFFKTEDFQCLFEIEAWSEKTRQLAHKQVADSIQQQIKTAFQIATVKIKKTDKEIELMIQSDNNRYMTNMWLNRADWAKYLTELNCEWLRHLICRSERWEKKLKRICTIMKMMI